MPDTQDSWFKRMGDSLAETIIRLDPSDGTDISSACRLAVASLEQAAEIKNVKLKTLLGRCMEVLREHQDCSSDVCSLGSPDGLREQIEEAIK